MTLKDAKRYILRRLPWWLVWSRWHRQLTTSFAPLILEEWRLVLLGYASGATVGTVLARNSAALSRVISADWIRWRAELAKNVPSYWYVIVPVLVICLWEALRVARRVIKSWLNAVIRGTFVLSFITAAAFFLSQTAVSPRRGIVAFVCCCLLLPASFITDLIARLARDRSAPAPTTAKNVNREPVDNNRDPDSPIESWAEDRLGGHPSSRFSQGRSWCPKPPLSPSAEVLATAKALF
jgi:hypothetical protein